MKHLIETTNPSGLATVRYDRIVLNSSTNDVIVKGGGYEYVDLGLSVKWAKCNIGAETETEYGDYFQWGETTPDTDYTWATYKYCNGSYNTLKKYNDKSSYGTVDNKTVLDPEDDAATQIMGGNWRMPTETEIQELYNNTTNEWITNYKGSGVNGRKFTSKADTSKYIFIPAAGEGQDGSVDGVGNYSRVWSSLLRASNPSTAGGLHFDSSSCGIRSGNRCFGRSVRGVCN